MMKFWTIAYQFEEDVFFDFSANDTTFTLNETCFLPTESMAKEFIEENLNIDFVPVEIELERLEKNGVWTYVRGKVERWDEEI